MNWHEVTGFVPSKIIVNMVHCFITIANDFRGVLKILGGGGWGALQEREKILGFYPVKKVSKYAWCTKSPR